MKLMFIGHSLDSGGAERVMAVLSNNFSEIGYNVLIVSKEHKSPFYDLSKKVQLIYPPTEINYKNGFTTLISRLIIYRNIYQTLKKEKPDLVISFISSTNGIVILICKMLGIPVIASEHTNHKVGINSLPNWVIKRWIYPMANALTVLTERDKVKFYGRFMQNVVVMPNPLPIRPLEDFELSKRENVVLAVGSIKRWKIKGFDNLLKIFSLVVKEHPVWKLKIVGGGDPEYLIGLIEDLKLNNSVELMGQVKNIQELMQQSSIFVLTSRWEGLPMVLIEAMSQGMACISYDCFTGPAEIITDKKDGILIEDQNIEEFVKNLSYLIKNEKLRITLGKNAIETSKTYLPKKIIAKWKTLIKSINQNLINS